MGTGFHPELTGRENIQLNGAILGMTRAEIKSKFDEIVEFSEIGRFLDTPVKRYSSGMYVRLAFAVAAHLEPEILIVDEVLAVGDAAFQKKCLGKMGDIAHEGRTVLFVSHNMQTVSSLCTGGCELRAGRVVARGPAREVIQHYLTAYGSQGAAKQWTEEHAPGDDDVLRLLAVRVVNGTSEDGPLRSSESVNVEITFRLARPHRGLQVGFDLMTSDGTTVLRTLHTDGDESDWPALQPGLNRLRCEIPPRLLNDGRYAIAPRARIKGGHWAMQTSEVVLFDVVYDHAELGHGWTGQPGCIAPILTWSEG